MTVHGRHDENIIEQNIIAGNDPVLGELVAAYNALSSRFVEGPTQFYTNNSASNIQHIRALRPSIDRFVTKNPNTDLRSMEFLVTYAEYMRRQGLPYLFSVQHLQHYLEASIGAINVNSSYHTTKIPKRSGGYRRIDAPSPELKEIQSRINRKILRHVHLNNAATGFRVGKSIKDNAEKHQKRFAVYSLDLEDFFHTVSQPRVVAALSNLGYTQSVSRAIAELCCYRGSLPMGSPASPSLANLVASRLDRRLSGLAKKEGIKYSRYADDITLSFMNRKDFRVIPLVKQIIVDEGFKINRHKESLQFQHQRQYVTGIVVNAGLNVKREDYKKIRAVIHSARVKGVHYAMEQWGAESLESFKAQINGHIQFISMVNPNKAEKLRSDLSDVRWNV